MRRVWLVACVLAMTVTLSACTHYHSQRLNSGTMHDKVQVLSTILHSHGGHAKPHH
jgi:hypothetical protein